MARIVPITDRFQVPQEYQYVVDRMLEVFGGRMAAGPHAVLLHRPAADALAIEMSSYFRFDSLVKSPLRDLAVITTASEKNALYIWTAQARNARAVGVAEDTISAIREGREPIDSLDAEIVRFVQQLLRHNRIEDAVFSALEARYGVDWVIELTMLVGFFSLLACMVNAFSVPEAVGGEPLPAVGIRP